MLRLLYILVLLFSSVHGKQSLRRYCSADVRHMQSNLEFPIHRHFLNQTTIDDILQKLTDIEWSEDKDFDADPDFQYDIYPDHVATPLDDLLQKICAKALRIAQMRYVAPLETIGAFVRRYDSSSRQIVGLHRDTYDLSAVLALSPRSAKIGGDLYVHGTHWYKTTGYREADMTMDERLQWSSREDLPIIDLDAGDLLIYDSRRLHGVTYLRHGWRYSLVIFFTTPSAPKQYAEETYLAED